MSSLAKSGTSSNLHIVCVPFPAQGHIRPMLKLAKLLHSKGFHITFVNTEFNHNRLLKSRGAAALDCGPTFRFVAIPDGIPPSDLDATQDVASMFYAVLNNLLDPFKELILGLNDGYSGLGPVDLIVSDCVMPFTLDAGKELGLPVVLFWTASACGFLGYKQYRLLQEKGMVPFKEPDFLTNGCLDMVVDWVPSMKGIRLKDIPSFIRTTDKDDILFYFLMLSVEKTCESFAPLILNTYDALEHEVLEDIVKIVGQMYTIGPLQFLEQDETDHDEKINSLGSNLWKEDIKCLKWLDSQKSQSVVYVSFGSITTMTKENLVEFAWGLANSKYPFLWIIRPDIIKGDSAMIPSEFLEETKDRGVLADWCDQEMVLNHPSTGVFLTHCGWNSSLDAIYGGVPVLCWPFFAEQQTNCWYFCNKWGTGMEINKNCKREEVEMQVREIIEGDKGREMKKNALEWKRLAQEATTKPSGSSYKNFGKLVDKVIDLPHNRKD